MNSVVQLWGKWAHKNEGEGKGEAMRKASSSLSEQEFKVLLHTLLRVKQTIENVIES